MPESAEATGHVTHALEHLVVVRGPTVGLLHRGRQIRPVHEFAALLVGEIQKSCEHPSCQLDRDILHPVERLVQGEVVQYLPYARRSEEHPSELQSIIPHWYAVF